MNNPSPELSHQGGETVLYTRPEASARQLEFLRDPVKNGSQEPPPGGLLEYWRIIRRRRGSLILIACLGATIGVLVTFPETPIYQVHTSLEILGLNSDFLNMKQTDPLAENSLSLDTSAIQTDIRIIQSESLAQRVMTKLRSGPLPPALPGRAIEWGKLLNLPDSWSKLLNLPDPGPVDPSLQALLYARKNFKVRAAGLTRIIDVTVDSPSADIAVEFANTLTGEFIDQNLESRVRTTEHTGKFLSDQLDDMRIRLEKSDDRLQQYASSAGLLFSPDEKTSIGEEKLKDVQQALSAAQTDRILKQSRFEMANTSPPEALPDILSDPALQAYQAKLTELKTQLADQSGLYTSEHPKIQRIQAQIATVQGAFDLERTSILSRIRNEYDESARREKLLEASYGVQRAEVTGEGERAIQYNILKREVDSNRQIYDAMLQQLKQASLASALHASNIRVVDPAIPPKKPYKPDPVTNGGLGLLSGTFLGFAFIVMRERADRSIQSPGETPFYVNLPELGVVPCDDRGGRVKLQISDAEAPTTLCRTELATWQRKPSMVAESFRATLVSILFSGENGSRPRVMVVTSPNPAEGKSTVVSNLAIAVAEVNQRVLLIDADIRKPRLHDIFNLKNDCGLSDLLRSKDGPPPENFIQKTSIPELYVMTSGTTTSAATSLLYSNRMAELIKTLRPQFETIFIDSPPMLQIPDARVLGRMVDRVILIVRAGKTTRDAVVAARQRFSDDGTQLLGTILNDWNPRRSPNGYYGYYNYGSYYNGYRGYYGSQNGSAKPGSRPTGNGSPENSTPIGEK